MKRATFIRGLGPLPSRPQHKVGVITRSAAPTSTPPEMKLVKLGDEGDIPAYVVGPEGKPAVIVIQEWWGVTDQVKRQAARIAAEGYRCLIPDLYKGKVGVDVEEAQHNMENLDFPGALQEIRQAAEWLAKEGSTKIGITGFCMGGALTLGGLAVSPLIVCGAPFYGCNFQLFDAQTLKKPVQGHFGMEDKFEGFSDPATGKKLQADLKAGGNKDVKVFFYPKVGHAFMNEDPAPFSSFDERQAKMGFPAYDEDTATHAWGRLLNFLKKHLT